MKRKVIAALLFGAAMAYFLVTGCTAFNDAPYPSYPVDAAVAKPDSTGSTGSGCVKASVPSEAPDPSSGTGGSTEVVVALHTISLGVDAGKISPDFGYDLDGVCTCAPDKGSCTNNKADAGNCDGDEGRDDGVGALIATLGIGDPGSFADDAIDGGVRGLLVRIQGYNEQPNDDSISLELYRSPGTDGLPDFGNPDQEWKVDQGDIQASGGDAYAAKTTGTGFVKDSQLVGQLDTSNIPFNSDVDIQLHDVSFIGNLVKDPTTGRWRIDNALGVGRWFENDAIATLAHVQDPTPGNSHQRICQNPLILGIVTNAVCGAVDLTQDPKQDNKNQRCGALSTVVSLSTVPAKLGPIVTPTSQDPCTGSTIPTCD